MRPGTLACVIGVKVNIVPIKYIPCTRYGKPFPHNCIECPNCIYTVDCNICMGEGFVVEDKYE